MSAGKTFWSCIDMDTLQSNNTDNPWGCHVVISLGFLVTLGTAACTKTPAHPRSFTRSANSDLDSKPARPQTTNPMADLVQQ